MQKQTLLKKGFTLIEIMVATVVMIIMVGLVIQITSEVLKVWNRSTGKLAANAEARIAMEILTSDLETAVFRNNGQQWLRVEGGTSAAVSPSAPYTSQTVALKIFAPALDRDTSVAGDICGIAYRLEFQKSYAGTNAPNVYALYRAIERPDVTFDALLDSGDTSTSNQGLLSGSKTGSSNTSALWTVAEVTNQNNFLALNVVDFKVLLYGVDTSGNEVKLNPEQDDGSLLTYAYGGMGGSNQLPHYADIVLRVISDEAMDLLTSGNISQTGFTVDQYIAANSEVFTRRVHFPARPL